MGSILNFVFPYSKYNIPSWFIPGPFTCHVEQNLNHTYDFEINSNLKNYILFETENKFVGFINNLNYKIKNNQTVLDLLKTNNSIGIILCSIADPASFKEKQQILDVLDNNGLIDRVYFIESNFQHKNHKNTFCWNFFIEDFAEDTKQIFLGHKNDLGYLSERIEESEINVFRNKKFLCFNRNLDRQHRISLLYDYINNDFSDSLFSFLDYKEYYASIYQFEPNDFDTKYFHQFLPIELDTHGLKDKSSFKTGDALGKKQFYLNTCIHLVTETSFEHNELFFSEKIIKPILNFQPFIVFGPFGYLEELKNLGFKTFSDFWDEGYDDVKLPKDRYFKIMNLVYYLNSKSIEELNNLYQKVKSICVYNYNHFYTIKFTIDKFLKQLEEN